MVVEALSLSTEAPPRRVGDLLQEAFALYKASAMPLLLTAGVFLVPVGLFSGFLLSIIFAAMRFLPAMLVVILSVAFTAFLTGLVSMLAPAALTIAVSDRVLGGQSPWPDYCRLAFGRFGRLLSAILPVALLSLLLSLPSAFLPSLALLFAVPQVLVFFFFSMVPLVAVFENVGGTEALQRSFALVRADWARVALVFLSYVAISFAAGLVGTVFFSIGLWPLARLPGLLLPMAVMPFVVTAGVLLYFDIRRIHEGLDSETLRQELEAARN